MTLPPDLSALRPVHRQERFATARVVVALILREMTSTYGRSPGGYAWAVIEPIAAIALLAWAFSLGLRTPQLGTNFMMFYATGWLPFHLFLNVSQKTARSLTYSRQLLAYPRVTIVDALLARYLLNLMVQLLVSYLILTGVRLFYDTGTTVELPSILLGFGMAAALAAGIGTLNCFLFSMFALWSSVWTIATRPLVLISGVIILVETIPSPWPDRLSWNPLVHPIAAVRRGFYFGYYPDYVSPVYVFAVSLIAMALGLLFLWRYHRDIREQ